MIIGGTSYRIQPWPEPKTTPAIRWTRTADGYHVGIDRGVEEDVYEGKIVVQGAPATLDSLQAVLEVNREGITLSGFNTGEMLFGADVNYSGSISATVLNFGRRRNLLHTSVFDLEITFRALSPTLLSTTPSLDDLHIQEGWEGDRSTDITKLFSYSQSGSYLQHGTDAGLFTAKFRQSTEEMKAIRAYLLTTARGEAFQFPALMADFYPFGPHESESQYLKCHAIAWEDRRLNLNRWELSLTLAQADPYFSGGEDGADVEFDHLTAGESGEPDTHGTPGG